MTAAIGGAAQPGCRGMPDRPECNAKRDDETGRFLPGNSGGRGGPKGAWSKLGRLAFVPSYGKEVA